MVEFVCWVLLVALLVMFVRTLGAKWGVWEYLQVNAPNDFIYKLLSCDFCLSFWLALSVSVLLAIFVHWYLIFIPIFSASIRW